MTKFKKELMRTFSKITLLSIWCVIIWLPCQAQDVPAPVSSQINRLMPKPLQQSPNVASLGKFENYQVDLFTGVPDISIPIFEVTTGNLKLPIVLNYHASGIKMNDLASWVGLGWSLSAGGQISRRTRGQADELNYAALNTSNLVPNMSTCNNYYLSQSVAYGTTDTEPDLFQYSFPGKSGKFLMLKEGSPSHLSPYLIPYEPIFINPNTDFLKFEITGEDGTLYRFGKNLSGTTAIEGSNTSAGSVQTSAATAWHLMDMQSANTSDEINFSYQSLGNATYDGVNNIVSITDFCYNTKLEDYCPSTIPKNVMINTSTTVGQMGLSQVLFNTGKIEFVLGTGNRSDLSGGLKYLDEIKIYSKTNGAYTLIKSVKFFYSYFRNFNNTSDLRLKLDAVHMKAADQQSVQIYSFTYFTNSFSWNNNLAKDYLGYYNGQTSNTDLIPPTVISVQASPNSQPQNVTIGSANRSTNPTFLTEGVLKRINYPTGGYSDFEFEANKYLENNTNITTGGLRVSKITTSDGLGGPVKIKTYRYGLNESGVGVKNFSANQHNYFSEQTILDKVCYSRGEFVVGVLKYRSRTYYSNSFDIETFSQPPVLYPYVTEYEGDVSGSFIGKTVYEYDNGVPVGSVHLVVPNSSKYFTDAFDWKNGKITKQTAYDKFNNKLKETVFGYSIFQTQSKFVGYGVNFYNIWTFDYCLDGGGCITEANETKDPNDFAIAYFSHNTGAMRQNSVVEYNYENGDVNKFVMISNSNTYDSEKLQPLQSTTTKSTGEQIVTVLHYPFQLSANYYSTGAAKGIYMLNNKNIVSTPIETYTYNVNGSNQFITTAQLTTYRQSEANPNYVVPDQIYVGEFPANYSQASYSPAVINGSNNGLTFNGNLKPRINMLGYSPEGNIKSVSKFNDAPISYQYGYSNSMPIAEVRNATDTKYLYTTYSTGTTSVSVTSSTSSSSPVSGQFTVGSQGGSVALILGVLTNPGYYFNVNVTFSPALGGVTSDAINDILRGDCALQTKYYTNVAAGTYSYTLSFTAGGAGGTVCGRFEYPTSTVSTGGFSEFSYENFEEGTVTTSPLTAHTGKGYVTSYTPTFQVPNGRSYTMEYWYWNGSSWVYTSKVYTGTNTPVNEGSAYDNVRIYPTDARMKSYTYDPILGITSVIDENGTVMYYDYDSFGRLARIRNDKGGVEKQYTYHYKGQ